MRELAVQSKTFLLYRSVNNAKLVKFNHFESIHYILGQFLLQTGAVLLQKGKLLQSGGTIITNRVDSCYYKVGQELLQSGTDIRKCDNFIKKWVKYYKVGELL